MPRRLWTVYGIGAIEITLLLLLCIITSPIKKKEKKVKQALKASDSLYCFIKMNYKKTIHEINEEINVLLKPFINKFGMCTIG